MVNSSSWTLQGRLQFLSAIKLQALKEWRTLRGRGKSDKLAFPHLEQGYNQMSCNGVIY